MRQNVQYWFVALVLTVPVFLGLSGCIGASVGGAGPEFSESELVEEKPIQAVEEKPIQAVEEKPIQAVEDKSIQAVEDKSILVMYRTKAFLRHAAYDIAKVNGEVATNITNGGWYAMQIDPGDVVIETKPCVAMALGGLAAKQMTGFETVMTFNAEPGRCYYLRFRLPGTFSMRSRFVPVIVEEVEALEELEDLKGFEKGDKPYIW